MEEAVKPVTDRPSVTRGLSEADKERATARLVKNIEGGRIIVVEPSPVLLDRWAREELERRWEESREG